MGNVKRGKGTKLIVASDHAGFPLAVHTAAATPHAVTLVPNTFVQTFTTPPEWLIRNKAYDIDLLDAHLAAVGIDMITEHRSNRKHPAIIGLAQKG